jgi:ABC-type anion transport system duplicated permease subunit
MLKAPTAYFPLTASTMISFAFTIDIIFLLNLMILETKLYS